MVFITGDCDKDYSRFEIENFPQQREMTKDDYVIVCGNLGVAWYGKETPQYEQEEQDLDWLDNLPFTLLFIDGNCENFEELNKYPVKEWNGGRVHEIRPSVLHLIRGEVFELCGKKIFAFGGIDYSGWGDNSFKWDENGNWKKEAREYEEKEWGYNIDFEDRKAYMEPSEVDIENAVRNLEKHNYEVDYMVTFSEDKIEYYTYVLCERGATLAACVIGRASNMLEALTELGEKTKCDRWFVGYHHMDIDTVRKIRYIYKDFVRLA